MTLPKTPSFRLDGKRALVAGASSGIGMACAVALAEAGAHVTFAARRADVLDGVVTGVRDAGFQAQAHALDVTDTQSVRDLFSAQAFDIVLNSAGLARHSAAVNTTEDDFDAVMNINVRAAYFLAQQGAKAMISARKQGSIIQISSQMAHVGGMDRAVYCGSKHAIEGINKAMAIEFGPSGIRVNSICPTFILTPLTKPTFEDPERRAWIDSKIKLPRVGQVEDIMGVAVFLASEASGMITGTSILVDGGWTAG
ncbi:SDR family oxidoreductase [Planktotalea sp.]|uniref:SDR family NAD(P)-dependent oxidoreductase n=1 Tax=Planktotalea sp. TaxID=2029877 RepID=UPI0025FC5CD0|nr:SDR family oxidoreductase [Planktotalea sp.]